MYNKAPLPFVGQKRRFLKKFREVLAQIPNDGDGWTIVDAFGGSGLLANNAKALKPKARVIYNDYDDYSKRLAHVDDTNRLRRILREITKDASRLEPMKDATKQRAAQSIKDFDGYIDLRCLVTWLLFSGKQVASVDGLFDSVFYGRVAQADVQCDGYLTGVEVTRECFETLLPKYASDKKALFVLDPPYVASDQKSYRADYFGMTRFLRLMRLVRAPYVFFSSTKSEVLEYMDFIQDVDQAAWRRLGGFSKATLTSKPSRDRAYEDNMLWRFS